MYFDHAVFFPHIEALHDGYTVGVCPSTLLGSPRQLGNEYQKTRKLLTIY